jgi:hypothetical protein
LVLLGLAFSLAPAWGQGEDLGGGEEEEEKSTKTFDLGFSSHSFSQDASAGISYTVPLTPDLDFTTSTGLGNGVNAEDNGVSQGHSISFEIDYDSPSPWRLGVGYTNSYSLEHRPLSEEYDEFKTESSSNALRSTLAYEVSSDLKTDLNLSAVDSFQETLIAEGTVPPPSTSQTYTYGGGLDYNATAATTLSVDYSGGVSKSKLDVAKTKTYPPREAKPALSRAISNSLTGQIESNKDITEDLNLRISFSASDDISRDRLQPALDRDALNGIAQSDVTYAFSSVLSFTNSVSFTQRREKYHEKALYKKQFNDDLYDTEGLSLVETANFRLLPGEHSEISLSLIYDSGKTLFLDDYGQLPPPSDFDRASRCVETDNYQVSSYLDLALGEDITFHMTYDLRESRPHRIIFPEEDSRTRSNNLSSTIGFDWTENLKVNVYTAMGLALFRLDDPVSTFGENRDDLNVNLSTTFIYDLSANTSLEIATDISKKSITYVDPLSLSPDSATITRHLATTARREFGQLFKPSIQLDLTQEDSYFPASLGQNRRRLRLGVSPQAEVNTSDSVKLNFTFNYGLEETQPSYLPAASLWQIKHDFGAGLGITYIMAENLTANLFANHSHTYTIYDSRRRAKEIPEETFFDLDASVNYTF